jgi:hypothetical protein
MKNAIVTLSILLAAVQSFANSKTISIETTKYPAPAALHLDHIQQRIAVEAVQACGSIEKLKGVSQISIKLTEGISGIMLGEVSEVTEPQPSLQIQLNYPKIKVTARAVCR